MKLFIGNATKQNHDFAYWIPRAKSARIQRVPIGGQVMISGDLDQEAIDAIIQQHAPYGLVAASEADHVREFVGLCYSVNLAIRAEVLEKLMHHNTRVLVEKGKVIRKEASVAGNDQLQNNLTESGRPETLRQMETSLVEENHDDRSPDPQIAEGYRVIQGGAQDPGPQTARQRRRAGRKAA